MLKVTTYNSQGQFSEQSFEDKGLADSFLLDNLRGSMSMGNKAFAVVSHKNEVKFVIIQENSTKWLSPEEFFFKVDVSAKL